MPKDIDDDNVDIDDTAIEAIEVDADLEDLSDDDLLDDDALDEDALDDDVLDDAVLDDDEAVGDVDLVGDEGDAVVVPKGLVVVHEGDDTPAEDEDEDDIDDDDVEAGLDVILKERLVVDDEEDEDEDEPGDAEDRGDGNLRVLPKQPGEFVCRSCFLVKSESQLANATNMLCRDCV